MTFKDFMKMYDCESDAKLLLNINGVENVQEISANAKPLMTGILDYIVAYFGIEDGKLYIRLEEIARPF